MQIKTSSDAATVTIKADKPFFAEFSVGFGLFKPTKTTFHLKRDAEKFLKTLPKDWLIHLLLNR